MQISTILFDFFGTLVHYERAWDSIKYPATDALLRDAGWEGDDAGWLTELAHAFDQHESASAVGLTEFSMMDAMTTFLHRLQLEGSAALTEAVARSYLSEWKSSMRPIAGLPEMVSALHGRYRLGIVSNTHDVDLVPDLLDDLGIRRFFDVVLLSVAVGLRKPHPAIYEHALTAMQAAPDETLFVGDNREADYDGPRRAGLHALLITDGNTLPTRHRIASILDLPSSRMLTGT